MARRRKFISTPDGGRGWAEYVQSHLDALGWTNAVLAQKSDMDRSLIGRWLNDGTLPTIDSIRAVCSALDVSIREGLVAAGLFTEAEMLLDRSDEESREMDLRFIDDDTLLDEVKRRLKRRGTASDHREAAASAQWGGVVTEVPVQAGQDVGDTQETRATPRVPTTGSGGP